MASTNWGILIHFLRMQFFSSSPQKTEKCPHQSVILSDHLEQRKQLIDCNLWTKVFTNYIFEKYAKIFFLNQNWIYPQDIAGGS